MRNRGLLCECGHTQHPTPEGARPQQQLVGDHLVMMRILVQPRNVQPESRCARIVTVPNPGPQDQEPNRGMTVNNPGDQRLQAASATQLARRKRTLRRLRGTAFVLGQSAPHSGVLTGLDGPVQAGLSDLASTADSFGFLCLEKWLAGVPVGEEQLGILAPAGSAVTPGDQDGAPFKVSMENLHDVGWHRTCFSTSSCFPCVSSENML